ncbi:hypothetical protein Dimus_004344, partial [Dionaea muscipula]
GNHPPAEEYLNYAERSKVDLVELFKTMQIVEDELLENGDAAHDEVHYDSAELVNGKEAEEKWGMNSSEVTPSA